MRGSKAVHIITGGTGIVGSAIILELLRTTNAHIIGLTRPKDVGARARLHRTLEHVARLEGYGHALADAIATRCEAVAADVHARCCGVDPRPEWRGAELWHCAASLQFQDRFRDAIFETNVDGARHVAALAEAAKVGVVNLVSTAYVAGTRSGVIREAPVEAMSGGANNYYERSKIAAEQVFADSRLERVRVLRPGIVIGHSRTRAALNYNGLYGFLRKAYKFRQLLERTQRELGRTLEIRMIADERASLSLIPVDHVAHDAVALSRVDAGPGFYHLTTANPLRTRGALELIFASVGMRPPTFVTDRRAFTWLDEQFNDRVDFYSAYLVQPKRFSRAHTDRLVPRSPSATYVLDDAELVAFCRWYVDAVLAQRKPLPVTR